jgi:peptidoglycan/LPS O-acetylase OafA/YrhL
MRAAVSRLAFIDALKALASQLIVLHHLAFYGPMSDFAQDLAPSLISWLSQDARIAVQVFLVIGGFLADNLFALVRSRYLKLAIPYLAALLFSMACAFIARQWMEHDSIPDAPTARQFLAHALLLQNILGFSALSAGVWYIAIDFQLFALLLGTLGLARRVGSVRANRHGARLLGLLPVIGLGLASLFYFNRDAAWDDWALYFFAAYALGALAYWASTRRQAADWLGMMAVVGVAALLLDFRSRIAVALAVALMLGISQQWDFLQTWLRVRPLAFLGRISYSVFLLNFPVCLLINALFSRFALEDPLVNALGVLIAWAASIAAGALFYHGVESRTRQIEAWVLAGGRVLGTTLASFLASPSMSPALRLAERLFFVLRAKLRP